MASTHASRQALFTERLRIRSGSDYNKVIPGDFCPIDAVSFGDELFFCLRIMNQHHISIAAPCRIEGLPRAEGEHPNFDPGVLPKLRQDRR